MSYDAQEIFAVATGAGRAAIAIMRLSGPATGSLLDSICGRRPEPRRASLRRVRDASGETLDHALVLWMPGPSTYTGEDVAELHLHAGWAILDAVALTLTQLGARPAEPGEFTRRAFVNGRMDLLEAEAVADLIEAETQEQRRQALRQLEGGLGSTLSDWRVRLSRLVAEQEALIDFPDEDLPTEIEKRITSGTEGLIGELRAHLDDGRRGEKLREGLVFAVTGAPNVGKSTLVNALARREVAIVSPSAGTTRDVIETRMVLGDVPVSLVDTAGIRESADEVEREGVKRALARAEQADLVINVSAPDTPHIEVCGRNHLAVLNKADLVNGCGPEGVLAVSALSGTGVDALRARLAAEASRLTRTTVDEPLTRARHRAALRDGLNHLESAVSADLPELRGEELRLALRALGRLSGHVGVEDLLDVIFAQFCIGK